MSSMVLGLPHRWHVEPVPRAPANSLESHVRDHRADTQSLAGEADVGVHMETGIFNNDRGSRFFCRAPGGVMFEINTRADATPEYRGIFSN